MTAARRQLDAGCLAGRGSLPERRLAPEAFGHLNEISELGQRRTGSVFLKRISTLLPGSTMTGSPPSAASANA